MTRNTYEHFSSAWFRAGLLLCILSIAIPRLQAGRNDTGYVAVPIGLPPSGGPATGLLFRDQLANDRTTTSTPLSAAERAGLANKPPFSGKTDAQINDKIDKIRKSILTAIELAALEDRNVANWLLSAYRNRQLCLGLPTGTMAIPAGGLIRADPSPRCGNEPVTIFVFPCEDEKAYQPDLVGLLNTLLHEGRHAFQAWPASLPGNAGPVQQAQWALERHCNEIDASAEEVRRLQGILDALDSKEAPLLAGLISTILDEEFQGKPDRQKQTALSDLRRRVRELKTNAERRKTCRETYKTVLQEVVAGTKTAAEANAALNRLRWYTRWNDTATEFGRVGLFAGGGRVATQDGRQIIIGDTDIVQQSWDGVELKRFAVGGVDVVVDVCRLDAAHILVMGDDLTTGFTSVFGYQDSDADGCIDNDRQLLYQVTGFHGGGDLLLDPATGQVLVYSLTSGSVYGLGGIGPGNPFPSSLVHRGSFTSAGPSHPFLAISPDGTELFAMPDEFGSPLFPGITFETSIAAAPGGEFVSSTPYNPWWGNALVAPAFASYPVAGATGVHLTGAPGTGIGIYILNGDDMVPFGFGIADANGVLHTPVSPALSEGQQVLAMDTESGLSAPLVTIGPAPPFVLGDIGFLEGDFVVEFLGIPGTPVTVEYLDPTGEWTPVGETQIDTFGNGFFKDSGSLAPPIDVPGVYLLRGSR